MPERFPMAPLTLQELLAILEPGLAVPWAEQLQADSICIDSREAQKGSLFVAFVGEQVDGHAYVPQALAAGARLALVQRPVPGVPLVDTMAHTWPPQAVPATAVRVPDTLLALQVLAHARRQRRPDLRVIGVTGSVGKTTTKEVIASVLAQRYSLLKSGGNRNNEIGLPLTLMTLQPEHQRAVLEMGMYALGEIAALCDIAQPQVGVVTNVAPIHLERLGSIEHIALAKAELVRALPPEGVAVLQADDPRVMAMAAQTAAQVVSYGEAATADIRAEAVESQGLEGSSFTVRIAPHPLWPGREGTYRLQVGLLGQPAVLASLAAIAVGLVEGLDWSEIERGLRAPGLGLRLTSKPGRRGITLLDDSYNSSPPAALAALDLLRPLGPRRIAVLGDMLELGDYEAEGHRLVGERAAASCDLLVTVGSRARGIAEAALAEGLPAQAIHTTVTNEEALACLEALLRPGDVVLIKGSRSMQMEEIVQAWEMVRC